MERHDALQTYLELRALGRKCFLSRGLQAEAVQASRSVRPRVDLHPAADPLWWTKWIVGEEEREIAQWTRGDLRDLSEERYRADARISPEEAWWVLWWNSVLEAANLLRLSLLRAAKGAEGWLVARASLAKRLGTSEGAGLALLVLFCAAGIAAPAFARDARAIGSGGALPRSADGVQALKLCSTRFVPVVLSADPSRPGRFVYTDEHGVLRPVGEEDVFLY